VTSKNATLIEQYAAIRKDNHWQSWPGIRHLRALRFRRLRPFHAGKSSGLSVIRYYWADFLMQHRADIRGRALEVGETLTIRQFGGNQLTQAEALDLAPHSPEVTIVADLSRAEHVEGEQFDCFVNQFTTAVIFDIRAALYHAIRLLRPGGVLLINFWCVDYYLHRGLDMGTGAPLYMHHWFTPIQVHNLLHGLKLTEQDYSIKVYGNLLTRMAFLMNVPAREFTLSELNTADPGQPLLICARIKRPQNWQAAPPAHCEPCWQPHNEPDRMRADTGHYGNAYIDESNST
jgi:SAM-dependent methyltransferase